MPDGSLNKSTLPLITKVSEGAKVLLSRRVPDTDGEHIGIRHPLQQTARRIGVARVQFEVLAVQVHRQKKPIGSLSHTGRTFVW